VFFGLPFESHGTPLEPNRILCQNFPLYTPAWLFFAPGARPGFAFKLGPMGLGYYQDVAPDGEDGDLVNGGTCRFDSLVTISHELWVASLGWTMLDCRKSTCFEVSKN